MALVMTRRPGEELVLFVAADTDPMALLRQLQAGITICVTHADRKGAALSIDAPRAVHILRPEVCSPQEWLEGLKHPCAQPV